MTKEGKKYSIIHSDGLTIVRFLVEITKESFISAVSEVAESYDMSRRLWDVSVGLNLSSEDIEAIAYHLRITYKGMSKAAVVAPTDLAFGLSRMLSSHRDDDQTTTVIFRNADDAIKWLKSEV